MIVQYKKCDACGKEFPIDTQLTSAEMLGAGAEICDECKAALVGFLSTRGKAPVTKTYETAIPAETIREIGAPAVKALEESICGETLATKTKEDAPNHQKAIAEDSECLPIGGERQRYNFSISDVLEMDNALIGAANSLSKEELQDLSDDDKRAIGEALYYGYTGRTIAEDATPSGRAASSLRVSYSGHIYGKTPDLLAIKVFEREYLGSTRPCVTKRISKDAEYFRGAIIRYVKMRLESDAETKDLCKSPHALSNSKKAIVAEHVMQITNNGVRHNKSKASGSSKHYHSKYCIEALGVAIYAPTPKECKVRFFDQWVLGVLENASAKKQGKTESKAELESKVRPKAELEPARKPRILGYDAIKYLKLSEDQARLLYRWEWDLQAKDTASLLSLPKEKRLAAGEALIACQEEPPSPFKPRGHYHGTMLRYRMRFGGAWLTLPENGRWGEYVFCAVSGLAEEAAKVESEVALAPDYEVLWKHASSRLTDCLLQLKKGSTAALLSKSDEEKIAAAKELRTIFGRKIQINHQGSGQYTCYAINWGKRTVCLRGAKSEEGADIAFYHLVFGLPVPEKDDTPPKKPERKRAIVRKPKERTSLVQVFDGKIEEDALGRVNKCLDAICKTTHLDKKYILSTIYADMERVYGVNLNSMCAQLKQETGSSARVSPFIAIMCDKTLSKIFENKIINKMAELGVESPEDVTKYAQGVIDKHLSEDVF